MSNEISGLKMRYSGGIERLDRLILQMLAPLGQDYFDIRTNWVAWSADCRENGR